MKSKKSILMLFLLMFTVVFVSVSSIAAFLADADATNNAFVVGGSNITIDEDFDPKPIVPGVVINKKVRIKNDGPTSCYIRVRASFSDSDVGKYATIDFDTTDWVYDSSDEYYYYKHAVSKGNFTSYLMTKITISSEIPSNMIKDVDLYVYAESYQSTGYSDYKSAWADYQKNIK